MKAGRPIRVALVGPGPQSTGGTASLVQMMLERLPDSGVEARAVATNAPPSWLPAGLDRVRYLRTGIRFATYLGRLVGAALWADVVHTFAAAYVSFLLEPMPAIIVGRLLRRRVVLNYHTGEAADHLRRWGRLVRWAAARADAVVVPSDYLRRIFARHGIRTIVVPNAVDVAEPIVGAQPGRTIVNTRVLDFIYDIPTTLRAFALIGSRFADARLVLVAGGPQLEACRRLAGDLGLRGVQFIGGVAPNEVARHLAGAALFLNSSTVDNQPLSILEAFAHGVPVVSTNAGGIPDLIRDGETGLLAPIGDHGALAERACAILGDRYFAGRIAEAGRAVARKHAWAAVCPMWLHAYGARQAAPAPAPAAARPPEPSRAEP